MRQIFLDTETTGLEPSEGHRIIEIGCLEMIDRRLTGRKFHQYLQPDREIDAAAIEVHNITNEALVGMPRFPEVLPELRDFLAGAQLIIHNAAFDIGFLNHECALAGDAFRVELQCDVLDTLVMARKMHPGQKNNLDALCRRYGIDNSHREWHGALLDAGILADVYLAMTGGQTALGLGQSDEHARTGASEGSIIRRLSRERAPLKVIRANADDLQAHEARLSRIDRESGGNTVWRKLATPPTP